MIITPAISVYVDEDASNPFERTSIALLWFGTYLQRFGDQHEHQDLTGADIAIWIQDEYEVSHKQFGVAVFSLRWEGLTEYFFDDPSLANEEDVIKRYTSSEGADPNDLLWWED